MILHRHRPEKPARLCLITVLAVFFSTNAGLAEWNKPPFSGRPSVDRRKPSAARLSKPKRAGGQAKTELYKLSPQQFRMLETQEMFTLAQKMYQFDESRKVGVYNEITRIQAERWDGIAEMLPFIDLLTRRQQLYMGMLEESRLAGRKDVSAAELRRNREFSKILRDVRLFERRHRHRFSDVTERIEPLLAPATVEKAHRQWRQRASLAQSTIKLRGLLEGLSSKRFKKSATAANPSKTSDKTAVGARPGPAKPPSGQAGSHRGPVQAKPNRRAQQPRPAPTAQPLSGWEKHVRDFIRRYELNPSQTNAALSILKEMTSRAVQIEKANESARAAAEKIADASVRRQRLVELDKSADDLFHRMNRRLDNLLTAAQRDKAPGK